MCVCVCLCGGSEMTEDMDDTSAVLSGVTATTRHHKLSCDTFRFLQARQFQGVRTCYVTPPCSSNFKEAIKIFFFFILSLLLLRPAVKSGDFFPTSDGNQPADVVPNPPHGSESKTCPIRKNFRS